MPTRVTLTSTQPGPGEGTGTVSRASSPGPVHLMARMVCVFTANRLLDACRDGFE